MRNVLVLVTCLAIIVGCKQSGAGTVYQPPVETSYGRAPDDPDMTVASQLREGSVQMAGAADTIESALDLAKKAAGSLGREAKQAAQDVVDLLDDAGASVADAAADPLTLEEVRKSFAVADDDRKARISSGNDAYKSLETALGTIEGLEAGVEGLATLKENIELAIKDVAEAIEALGGKVESEALDPADQSTPNDPGDK